MNKEYIIKLARDAGVPDYSCNPEGQLMPWVVYFYNIVLEEAARKVERMSNGLSTSAAIRNMQKLFIV